MTKAKILTIGGIVALAVVAIIGWTRSSEPTPAPAAVAQPDYNNDRGPAADYPSYAARPSVRTITPPPAQPAPQAEPIGDNYYADYPDRSPRRARVVTRERPLSHSAAIVGGSAGVGAAIGALAGGGKGAGIGALSGGGAGFVYDRLTHKRKVVVEQ